MNEPTTSGTPPSVEGIVSRPSPFSVEETLERLKASIRSRNLTLFAQIDHSDLARGVGLTMQEAHVLVFGNPKGGTPLMIASPLLALDLRTSRPRVTVATHGEPFAAAVEDGLVSATQFHPEKSGDAGAAVLKNWLETL